MKIIILIILFLITNNVFADQDQKLILDFSTVAATIALYSDYRQTRWMSKNWDSCKCNESNPSLGNHPTTKKVNQYFGLIGLGFIAAQYAPDWFRFGVNAYIVIEHGGAVIINYQKGIKM